MNKASQKQEYLNQILDILVDPLDSRSLKLKDDELQGKKTTYEIVNNIPIMIPPINLRESIYREQVNDLWKELQNLEYTMYLDNPVGVFSHENHKTAIQTGNIINALCEGNCLDIGCGALPFPSYMKAAPKISFYGTDPYFGNVERDFPFAQSLAECLPFKDESFDNALIATSLDHMYFPEIALTHINRVLKDSGNLFVWQTCYPNHYAPYQLWASSKAQNPAQAVQFDAYHQWAFTRESLSELLEKTGFNIAGLTLYQRYGNGGEEILIHATKKKEI